MSLPLSRELGSVLQQARDIARKTHQVLSSAHLLLALFTVPNKAAIFLQGRDITVDKLLGAMNKSPGESEDILTRINERSELLAQGSNAENITSLHLLAALLRENSSHAWRILDECGTDIGSIRASVMSYATDSRPIPRRSIGWDRDHDDAPHHESAETTQLNEYSPSQIGFHPDLNASIHRQQERASMVQNGYEHREHRPRPKPPMDELPAKPQAPAKDGASPDTTTHKDAVEDARNTARLLARNLFARRREAERKANEDAVEEPQTDMADESPNNPAEQTHDKPDDADNEQTRCEEATHDNSVSVETNAQQEIKDANLPTNQGAHKANKELAAKYQLDPDIFPMLTKFGRNLTEQAALARIDRVIGRDEEITRLIEVLGKRRSNNPLLVGEAGVGKTAIVEGLACMFVEMAQAGNPRGERAIIELEVGRLLSGTHLRGSFSERLLGLKDEVRNAGGDVIVFLDEIHMWMSSAGGGDGGDAAGELKTALARGEFPCIGATTHDEFRKFIETDPAFERRFQQIVVEEPDVETSIVILRGIQNHYEQHHGVQFENDAIDAAVRLSHRYINDGQLPDKAINVVDLAGSRAARLKARSVTDEMVAHVIAEIAGIPADRLTRGDRERFLQMESFLTEHIIGHHDIIETIANVIRRNYAGFRSRRPIGSFLFLGSTGIGKTEMVKALADFMFHDRDAMVRFDMSEFMEAHSVSRLIGSPPGYVGYDQGGQLTEAIRRRPYQVVLLDEIEKAHTDVLNILLQLFDEGHLTDSRGRRVDFSNALVIMTSNLGTDAIDDTKASSRRARIGFSDSLNDISTTTKNRQLSDKVLESARRHFTPELWNRIDERLVFLPLSKQEIAQIAHLQLRDTNKRLIQESDITLSFDDAVVHFLVDNGGFDPKLGARPMRQTVQRLIENPVARLILQDQVTKGGEVRVVLKDDTIVCIPQ